MENPLEGASPSTGVSVVEDDNNEYVIENAKIYCATCKKCNEKIRKGDVTFYCLLIFVFTCKELIRDVLIRSINIMFFCVFSLILMSMSYRGIYYFKKSIVSYSMMLICHLSNSIG